MLSFNISLIWGREITSHVLDLTWKHQELRSVRRQAIDRVAKQRINAASLILVSSSQSSNISHLENGPVDPIISWALQLPTFASVASVISWHVLGRCEEASGGVAACAPVAGTISRLVDQQEFN